MVYISSWQEFQEAAESLYEKSPKNTRYCVKWKAGEGKLVLKITDDVSCLKFKTYSSIFLNRFEALNLSLMRKMQNRQRAQPQAEPVIETVDSGAKEPVAPNVVSGTAGVAGGGGVKKKKPKKKK